MQTTEITTTEEEQLIPIRLTGGQTHLPLTTLKSLNLPNILKMEIEHPLFKDSGKQIEVINKITRMLGIQFQDEEDRKNAGGEWIVFCQSFRLTAPEIVEAYTMALRKELYINSEPIKVFPNLSVITAGEILKAYEEHKRQSHQLEQGKEKIKAHLQPPKPEPTPEERAEEQRKMFERIRTEVREKGDCEFAFLMYENIKLLPEFQKIRKTFIEEYDKQFFKFLAEQQAKRFSIYQKKELELKKQQHALIMERLKTRAIKARELEGYPSMATKNELVVKFLKTQEKK